MLKKDKALSCHFVPLLVLPCVVSDILDEEGPRLVVLEAGQLQPEVSHVLVRVNEPAQRQGRRVPQERQGKKKDTSIREPPCCNEM